MDVLANLFNDPRSLVAKNQGLLDNETPDPAVVVIVSVGAADADRRDPNQHLVRPWLGTLALLNPQIFGAAEH